MKSFKHIAIGAVAATAFAAPVMAGSLEAPVAEPAPVAPMPVAAPSYDWTGLYAGGQLGYGTIYDGATLATPYGYGAQAGYLYDFGSIVAGGEASYTYYDQDAFATDPSSIKVKGKLGYDAGRFLPFVTAGVGAFNNGTDTGITYVAGAGVDYAVTDNWRIGLEYNYEANPNYLGSTDLTHQEVALKVNYAF